MRKGEKEREALMRRMEEGVEGEGLFGERRKRRWEISVSIKGCEGKGREVMLREGRRKSKERQGMKGKERTHL